MRYGRAKAVKKALQFYQRSYGYEVPYHIILDGNFILATIQYKIPILDRLTKLLHQSPIRLYVIQSTLEELQQLLIYLLQQQQQQGRQRKRPNYQISPTNKERAEQHKNRDFQGDTGPYNTTKNNNKVETCQQAIEWVQQQQSLGNVHIIKCHRNTRSVEKNSATTTLSEVTDSTLADSVGASDGNNDIISNNKEKYDHDGNHDDLVWGTVAGQDLFQFVTTPNSQHPSPNVTVSGSTSDEKSRNTNSSNTVTTTPAGTWKAYQPSKKRYMVATQDEMILDQLRQIGSIPIIRLAYGSVLLFENPSKVSIRVAQKQEQKKWIQGGISGDSRGRSSEQQQLESTTDPKNSTSTSNDQYHQLIKQKDDGIEVNQYDHKNQQEQQQQQYRRRHKHKAKEPNPLSCKRKRTATTTTTAITNAMKSKDETKDYISSSSSKRQRVRGKRKKINES